MALLFIAFGFLAPMKVSAQFSDGIRPIRFSLDPAFLNTQSISAIRQNLIDYVADLNYVYGKNTYRQFSFDPITGIEFFTAPILGGQCYPVDDNHSYIIQIRKSNLGWSHSGNGGCNFYKNNQLYAMNLNWVRIYSRQEIAANELFALKQYNDYFAKQLFIMIHELGHLHGLGAVEYYSLGLSGPVLDTTGVAPNLSISATDPNNYYFSSRKFVFDDPMWGMRDFNSRDLDSFTFGPLSATLINRVATGISNSSNCGSPYYLPMQCFNVTLSDPTKPIVVQVLSKTTQSPLSHCQVTAYRETPDVFGSHIITQKSVDANGQTDFPQSLFHEFGSLKKVVFFKTSCNGYLPAGDALSYLDLQAAAFVDAGGSEGDFHFDGNLEIYTEEIPDATPPMVSILRPAEGSEISEKTQVPITFAATDDRALSHLRVVVNGVTLCEPTLAGKLYGCIWTVPGPHKQPSTPYTIQVIATDTSGNQTIATRKVTVINPNCPRNEFPRSRTCISSIYGR